MKPLDRFTTIKSKLSFVIVFAVGVTVASMLLVFRYVLPRPALPSWQLVSAGAASAAVGLGLARLLASGLTKPLRDMGSAAARLGHGDGSVTVHRSSNDEVGDLADAFNEMLRRLEEQEQMRRRLVANVSHELKTPLAALRAHLENLRDGVEHADPEVLAVLLDQAGRLNRLVDDLLDLSRLESGELRLETRAVGLRGLVDAVDAELGLGLEERPLHILNAVDEGVQVVADPERLHQVVYNLLDNARRHSSPGGRVEVEAYVSGGVVTVEVQDEGPGVAPEDRQRIFDRFVRGDEARARRDGGTGVGLAIVRSIVEAHGGRVHVERADSGGAAFRFTLPSANGRATP